MNSITSGERIATLDVIRGVAVMGIFSVNVIDFAMIQPAYFNPAAYGGHTGASLLVWALNMLFIDGKMRALFSMLFGASMLLVIERAEASGRGGWATHWRRMLVLLGFGLLHYFFVWKGDILTLYAVSGLVVFLFRRKEPRKLVVAGGIFVILSMALLGAFAVSVWQSDLAAHAPGATAAQIKQWNESGGFWYPSAARIERDRLLYSGDWWSLVVDNLRGWGSLVGNLIGGSIETIGLMLIGMAAYKSGLLTGKWSDPAYRRLALWGIGVGLLGHALLVYGDIASRFYSPLIMGGFLAAMSPFRIVQALGYAALLALVVRRGRSRLLPRLQAVGQTAFSNYLGTSLVATFVFYGWGLGLYGDLSRWQAWLLAPLVWAVMLTWSKPWLERFNYGPLEWAWRSLSRGKLQPMRRGPAVAAAPAG
ncbi:DUF418 domain-containing protein [Sphingomonas rosea]|uniref:DUF418 domain-containing protein n=1 Tax=Sphingomonas rosea TaxID=335605 RepID=A0ABP7TZG8_9SPHN